MENICTDINVKTTLSLIDMPLNTPVIRPKTNVKPPIRLVMAIGILKIRDAWRNFQNGITSRLIKEEMITEIMAANAINPNTSPDFNTSR